MGAGRRRLADVAAIRLRPVGRDDLALLVRFATEPWLVGLDWAGFRDAQRAEKDFEEHGFLRQAGGMLIVEHAATTAGIVSWGAKSFTPGMAEMNTFWEIGIALLPEHRGKGIGWQAQAALAEYLFQHTPVERIQAATHPENKAEQRSLEKAGFGLEGVVRAAEFRDGEWRDGYLYSRLRNDPVDYDREAVRSICN